MPTLTKSYAWKSTHADDVGSGSSDGNGGVVKDGPGILKGYSFSNDSEAPFWVYLYNMATEPESTDTPVRRFLVPGSAAGGGREREYCNNGIEFSVGIAFRCVVGPADNDTTGAGQNLAACDFDYA